MKTLLMLESSSQVCNFIRKSPIPKILLMYDDVELICLFAHYYSLEVILIFQLLSY